MWIGSKSKACRSAIKQRKWTWKSCDLTVAVLLKWKQTIARQSLNRQITAIDKVILKKKQTTFLILLVVVKTFFTSIIHWWTKLQQKTSYECFSAIYQVRVSTIWLWLQSLVTSYITWCGELTILWMLDAQLICNSTNELNYMRTDYRNNIKVP